MSRGKSVPSVAVFGLPLLACLGLLVGCPPTGGGGGGSQPTATPSGGGDTGGGGSTGGDGEPNVQVVPDSGAGSVSSRDGNVITFAAGGEEPEVGEVVVSVKDGGFLRRVESVTVEADGTVTTVTSQASLAEAVENGTFTFTDGPPIGKGPVRTKDFELVSFEKTISETIDLGSGVTVTATGDFNLTGDFRLDMTI